MASEALKVNKALTLISLRENKIGDVGAKAMAEVHSRCPFECSWERVSGSPYAFIAMLFAYRMDRSSVLSVVCKHLCQVSLLSAAPCIVFEEMRDTQCVVDT